MFPLSGRQDFNLCPPEPQTPGRQLYERKPWRRDADSGGRWPDRDSCGDTTSPETSPPIGVVFPVDRMLATPGVSDPMCRHRDAVSAIDHGVRVHERGDHGSESMNVLTTCAIMDSDPMNGPRERPHDHHLRSQRLPEPVAGDMGAAVTAPLFADAFASTMVAWTSKTCSRASSI